MLFRVLIAKMRINKSYYPPISLISILNKNKFRFIRFIFNHLTIIKLAIPNVMRLTIKSNVIRLVFFQLKYYYLAL